jgi:hypothetical protein
MKPYLRLIGAVFLALLPDPARLAHADGADSRAAAEHLTYTFEDEQVLGAWVTAAGEVLQVRKASQRRSLIHARESFVSELLKSVEAL